MLSTFYKAHTQTLGGAAAYNFLKTPYTPQLTAAGGINISHSINDIGYTVQNPALLAEDLHGQVGLSYTPFLAGIKNLHLNGAYHHEKWKTTFGAGVTYINYGSIQQTDAGGALLGNFRARDYAVSLSASRRYLEKWQYGLSVKWIQSAYQLYTSSAVAFDAGVSYIDTAKGITVAIVASNMGTQLKSYGAEKEELPFDLQAGVTKKMSKAPFAFSVTLQQLHRFNLLYNDTVYNNANNFAPPSSIQKVFNHFVFATHIYIGKQIEATIGYNVLRRQELSLGTAGNGLTGFSAGFAARFEKLHFLYGRSLYQRGISYNHIGINLKLHQLFGAGNF